MIKPEEKTGWQNSDHLNQIHFKFSLEILNLFWTSVAFHMETSKNK